MAIVKMLHDNKFIGIYEENNLRLIAKMAEYKSSLNEVYDIITEVKIINTLDNSIVYSSNTHMAYNSDGLISIVNYAEKILFYLHHEKCDMYWKKLFLDKLFQNMLTTGIELYYNRVSKQLQEEKTREEYKKLNEKIDSLQSEVQKIYNNKGMAVFYNTHNMYIINHVSLIQSQGKNKTYKGEYSDYDFIQGMEKDIERYKPYIFKHIHLDRMESDIEILKNELLEIA